MSTTAVRSVRWVDVVAPFALLALVATSSLRQEDIRFWDESMYLERGLSLGFGNQPGWEWNPLFNDTYWLLGRFFADPIDLYFAGRVTSAVFVVLAVWLSLRLFTRPWLALTGGIVMASLPITYVWPGVSNPSAAFILLGLAIAWRWRNPIALVVTSAMTWLAAATRPEFVWIAILVTIAVGASVVATTRRNRRSSRYLMALLAGLVAAPLVLTVGYGNPADLGTRSWEAFEQHYELRFATADDDPWQVDADIVGRDFPGAKSIPAAVVANPAAVGQHMARNAITLPLSAGGHFMGLGGTSQQQNLFGVVAAGFWVLGLAGAALRPRKNLGAVASQLGQGIRRSDARMPAVLTVVLLGASMVSALIIYPRPHYLVILVAAGLVVTGAFIDRLAPALWQQWIPVTSVIAIGVAALAFNAFTLATTSEDKPYATALRMMNDTDVSWRLLTPERPISIYLNDATQVLEVADPPGSFRELLLEEGINAVFDGILLRQANWAELKDFQQFLEDPADFGFRPITPGNPFLIRN